MQNSIKSLTDNLPFTKDNSSFTIMVLGDIMGEAGLKAVTTFVPKAKKHWNLDLISVNGENSDGFGMIPTSANKLLDSGVDIITGGNHSLRPHKILDYFAKTNNVLRPHNIGNKQTPGKGWCIIEKSQKVGVINLAGQIYMDPANSPFNTSDSLIKNFENLGIKIILLDFHAEATAEKYALARFLDGKISVFWGTHTHVQTADAQIFSNGTGYITDLGLSGSSSGIIGMKTAPIISKHRTGIPSRFIPAHKDVRLQGIIANIDIKSGKCINIVRLNISDKDF